MALDLGTLTAKIKVDDTGAMTSLRGFEASADKSTAGVGGKFKKLGGVVKKALGAAAVAGAAALGAACVKVGKDAYKAYAQFEQLEGGVQKIFGDEAAKEVMKNAEAAFKTAGISANQYMELTTSFSASLLQSLGGNAKEAAKVADMAIQDMSDNANVYGTSMESIQNAYQGFAKQNYTMLDNLKLGYGGTKTEMERLLADAGKLTGKKYDIQNLNDVYEAIHAIQVEQKVTGTTAKEASKTVEGSFNMMKASYENFVTALGTGDSKTIKKATTNLIKSMSTFAKNAIPLLENIIKGTIAGIPNLINEAMSILPGLIVTLVNQVPVLVNGALDAIGSDKFKKGAISLIKNLLAALIKMIPMLLKMIPKLLKVGMELIIAIGKGILSGLKKGLGKPIEKVVETVQSVKDKFNAIINKIKDIWNGLKLKAKNAKLTVIGGAIKVLQTFKDIWETIKNGIKKVFTLTIKVPGLDLLTKARDVWNDIIKKKAGNSNAPSKGGKTSTGGKHRNGLNFVPYDDYQASLHYGEMVLSRGEANRYRRFLQTAAPTTTQTTNPIYTNITVELDGQVVARKTAKFMNREINSMNQRNSRKRGIV